MEPFTIIVREKQAKEKEDRAMTWRQGLLLLALNTEEMEFEASMWSIPEAGMHLQKNSQPGWLLELSSLRPTQDTWSTEGEDTRDWESSTEGAQRKCTLYWATKKKDKVHLSDFSHVWDKLPDTQSYGEQFI